MAKNKKVRVSNKLLGKSEAKTSIDGKELNRRYPSFSFEYFCGQSIRVNSKLNNFYHRDRDAAVDAGRFYDAIKEVSRHQWGELISTKPLRFHIIQKQPEVEVIEKFLQEYKFSPERIREFSQGSYYQFSSDDGSRVICISIDTVLYVLFVDVNHFTYNRSSRNKGQKYKHRVPGYFTERDADCAYRSFAKAEMIDDLLSDFDSYKTKDDLREHLEFIADPDFNPK